MLSILTEYIIPFIFPYIFPVLTIAYLLYFYDSYRMAVSPRKGTLDWIKERISPSHFTLDLKRGHFGKGDIIPLLIICIVYTIAAFTYLASFSAPQSFWYTNTAKDPVVIDLSDAEIPASQIAYYTGIFPVDYLIEFSEDGKHYYKLETPPDPDETENQASVIDLEQSYANLFSWLYLDLSNAPTKINYVRLSAKKAPAELGEMGFYSTHGELLDAKSFIYPERIAPLFDEQELVQPIETVLNSTYFDEIYHARTAFEHIRNIYPYEITHPPLGKLIISLGIQLFGMTPFGWRFMGTIFGILMLPAFYLLLKTIFNKTKIAVCGTILFASDFMHFTQTRIATIDTYVVFFIILSYLFMYRYITSGENASFKKTLMPLFLSGLFFGLSCADKWTGIYSGAGLLVLYTIYLVKRGRKAYHEEQGRAYLGFLTATGAVSIIFFIAVPIIIYTASYIPYPIAKHGYISLENLWDEVSRNQIYMLEYHGGLQEGHNFGSPWYSWLVSGRPILYFNSTVDGLRSTLSSFGNPLIWWGGLLALTATIISFIKKKRTAALFIIIGYASQLLPWVFVSRVAFIYHYFPCSVFIILAICYTFDEMTSATPEAYKKIYIYTGLCALLFIVFFPAISGFPAPEWYHKYILTWIPKAWVV